MYRRWNCLVLVSFLCLSFALAQSLSSTADLTGLVTDQTSGVLPGATVTVNSVNTGLSRSVLTNDIGYYRVPLLPPGSYEVRVEMPGFTSKVVGGLRLTVGQTATLNVELGVSAEETEIYVTSDAAIVEKEKTVQSSTVQEEQIQNLPINGRNYLDFTLLTPGSSAKSSLISFSAPQTPSSGLSFAGQDTRSNYVTIDGVDNMDAISAGVRGTMGQDAIQEFQISRNTFSAEFGRSRGGLINIVSKSGTNSFHGNAFFFFRNNALDANNAFSKVDNPPFKRYEFGGTVGGPIIEDKTYFFVSFERLDRNESNFVTFLDDESIFQPSTSQLDLFSFLGSTGNPELVFLSGAFIHPQLGKLYTNKTTFPSTVSLFESESGTFPFKADQNLFSFKLDHQFSDNNNFFGRFSFGDSRDDGADFGALQGVSNGLTFDTRDLGLVLSDTHIFSASMINDIKFQIAPRDFAALTNDPVGPELILAGVAQFGREFFNPSRYDHDTIQITDNFTLIKGNHTLKTGVDFNRMSLGGSAEVFLGGQFSFGEAVPLGLVVDNAVGAGTTQGIAVLLGTPVEAGGLGRPDLIPNLSAPISSVQSFNFGLPLTYFQGFGDPTTALKYHQLGMFFQDNWKVTRDFTLNLGIRYDIDWRPTTTNVASTEAPWVFETARVDDHNNFSPRLGFAWDIGGKGTTVLRGGYGVFYQNFFQAIAFVSQVLSGQISQVFLPLTGIPGVPANSAHVYGAWRATGKLDQELLQSLGVTPGTTPSVILPGANNTVNPYSQHVSFGVERRLGRDWSLSLDYLLNKGAKLIRSRDINVRQIGDNSFTLPGLDPRFVQVNMIETSGSSIYHGFTGSLRKRYASNYSLMVSYTLGKAIDDTTDFITQLQPNNQKDLRSERSLSSFDQRQRFVFSGIYQSPNRMASGEGFGHNFLADWTIAPIISVNSGHPFNLLLGFDLNGDTHEETDRPVLTGGSIAGRNTGIGPAFFAADLRISRKFNFGESTSFEFMFEAFNLFNNVNYSGVNNVVGTTALDSASVKGSKSISPTQPFGFTSAFDPRQIQFGFRFMF